MDLTIFLAQIWGPVILAVGIGVFVSRSYYTKIYRELEKDALAVLLFGMIAMAVGIVHVQSHNLWNSLPEAIVSLLGWSLLIKGTLFAVAPGIVDKSGNWWASHKMIPFAGFLTVLVGAYLSWFAYFG